MTQNTNEKILAKEVSALLDSKKAEDVRIIDLTGTDYISQFVVVATAMAGKHALSLLQYIKDELRASGVKFYGVDEESENWIVIDLGGVTVHIFTENHRKKYNIEEFLDKIATNNEIF